MLRSAAGHGQVSGRGWSQAARAGGHSSGPGHLSAARDASGSAVVYCAAMPLTPAQLQRELTPTPAGTEAARAFYQARVSLFFAVISGISLVFFVLHNVLEVLSGNLTFGQVFTSAINHWHMGGVVVASLFAWVTRASSARFDFAALKWIEAGGCLWVLITDDMMGSAILGVPAPHFDLVLTLAYVLFQMTRAVIVPSTVRWTLAVCGVCAIPLLIMGWLLAARAPDAWSAGRAVYAPLYLALWCLDSTIPAAIASSVIYGLRQQVSRAKQLGQYTLEERLGEGGMGTVYRARHALLRRPTAIKLLRPERTGAAALQRFEREVQLTSQLTHPNTVSIYDYGRSADGTFYYAMEYLDGLDLQRLIEVDGVQAPARTVHVLTQICSALAEAHGLGLIHRDIKPANILLCERGGTPDVVKVVDFGLVKSLSGADEHPALSSAAMIFGTPHFLAPEAVRSLDAVDARTDLYALGAVGYFLLTGSYVFEGETIIEVCGHHLHTTPEPLSSRAPGQVPAALDALLLRCLAKDPAARPQSARELMSLLAACGAEAWSEAKACAWWERFRTGVAPIANELQLSPTLLEVDVLARGRSS
jgi:eukaryotic-like serine/threonine-protein kinase